MKPERFAQLFTQIYADVYRRPSYRKLAQVARDNGCTRKELLYIIKSLSRRGLVDYESQNNHTFRLRKRYCKICGAQRTPENIKYGYRAGNLQIRRSCKSCHDRLSREHYYHYSANNEGYFARKAKRKRQRLRLAGNSSCDRV